MNPPFIKYKRNPSFHRVQEKSLPAKGPQHPMQPETLRNLAIVAHIDAGKTTLSERLLYLSHEISSMGEVDDGLATMDYLKEEQKRGITIEAGIASYSWMKSRFTFFDTPGHLDFTSEMDSALLGVEGALLLISATSGIEPQTLEAWSKINVKTDMPGIQPILFINKMDLYGLPLSELLDEIRSTLDVIPFLMTYPIYKEEKLIGVVDILNNVAIYNEDSYSKEFKVEKIPEALKMEIEKCRSNLIDAATHQDQQLTEKVLLENSLEIPEIISGVRKTLAKKKHLPVYIGSALFSVGIRQVMNGIHFFLPEPQIKAKSVPFEVLRKKMLVDTGQVYFCKLNQLLKLPCLQIEKMYRLNIEELVEVKSGFPGEILALKFESGASTLSFERETRSLRKKNKINQMADEYQPLLKTRIEVSYSEDFEKVDKTIKYLASNDASINLETDRETGLWIVSTMGEVQLDVFCERLERDSGSEIKRGNPQITFFEKLKKSLKSLENFTVMGDFQVSIKISITPVKSWKTTSYLNKTEFNSSEYEKVFDSVVTQFSQRGVRGFGNLLAFKLVIHKIAANTADLPAAVLKKNLSDCLNIHIHEQEVDVFEPVMKLTIKVSSKDCGRVIHDLASRGGVIKKMESGYGFSKILCHVPLKGIFNYATLLRSLSKGQGTFYLKYEKHQFFK